MSDLTNSVCRLCLSIAEVCQYVDLSTNDEVSDIMQGLFPGMNWNLVSTPKICLACVKKLKFAYIFKETIVQNEYKIKSDPSAKSALNSCRLCLNEQQSDIGIILLYENSTSSYQLTRTMTEIATTQLDFDIFPKPIMCAHCWSVVKEIYSFKKVCFKTEEKLEKLSIDTYSSVNVLSNVDIVAMLTKEKPNSDGNNTTLTVKNESLHVKSEVEEFENDDSVIMDSVYNLTSFNPIETKPDITTIGNVGSPSMPSSDSGNDNHIESKENASNNTAILKQVLEGSLVLPRVKQEVTDVAKEKSAAVKEVAGKRYSKNNQNVSHARKGTSGGPQSENSWYKLKNKTYYCMSCKYRSPVRYRVLRHYRSLHSGWFKYKNKTYYCVSCQYQTSAKKLVISHYRALHGDQTNVHIFKCNICSYKAKRRDQLRTHMNSHVSSKPSATKVRGLHLIAKLQGLQPNSQTQSCSCHICGFRTQSKAFLVRHVRIIHGKKIECKECEYVTSQQKYMQFHMKQHSHYNELGNKCQKCEFFCKNPFILDRHIRSCGNDADKTKESTNVKHVKIVQGIKMECKECEYVTSEENYMQSHMKQHSYYNKVGNKCQKCGFLCKNPFKLERHIRSCRNVADKTNVATNVSEKTVKCKLRTRSPYKFSYSAKNFKLPKRKRAKLTINGSDRILSNGFENVTARIKSEKDKPSGTFNPEESLVVPSVQNLCSCGKVFTPATDVPEKKFECKICKKTFKSSSSFRKHKLIHSVEDRFLCNICGKGFKVRKYYMSHLLSHSNERNSICYLCEKTFKSNESLRIHMRTHSIEREYLCHICAKAFLTIAKMRDHIQLHQTEKKFQCNFCHRSFKIRRYLTKHITSKHSSYVQKNNCRKARKLLHKIESKYGCLICKKSFANQHKLNSHMASHSEDRNYDCDVCSKSFKTKTALQNHKILHKQETFDCYHCGYKAKRKDYLITHMLRHMSENAVPKFRCSHCEHTSTRHDNLAAHIKRVHTSKINSSSF